MNDERVSLEAMRDLMGPAFTIAALGAIESLLSAMVADGMTGRRHRSNCELVAQGIANVVAAVTGDVEAPERRVYRSQNVELPRNSREQARVSTSVAYASVRTGDLSNLIVDSMSACTNA